MADKMTMTMRKTGTTTAAGADAPYVGTRRTSFSQYVPLKSSSHWQLESSGSSRQNPPFRHLQTKGSGMDGSEGASQMD